MYNIQNLFRVAGVIISIAISYFVFQYVVAFLYGLMFLNFGDGNWPEWTTTVSKIAGFIAVVLIGVLIVKLADAIGKKLFPPVIDNPPQKLSSEAPVLLTEPPSQINASSTIYVIVGVVVGFGFSWLVRLAFNYFAFTWGWYSPVATSNSIDLLPLGVPLLINFGIPALFGYVAYRFSKLSNTAIGANNQQSKKYLAVTALVILILCFLGFGMITLTSIKKVEQKNYDNIQKAESSLDQYYAKYNATVDEFLLRKASLTEGSLQVLPRSDGSGYDLSFDMQIPQDGTYSVGASLGSQAVYYYYSFVEKKQFSAGQAHYTKFIPITEIIQLYLTHNVGKELTRNVNSSATVFLLVYPVIAEDEWDLAGSPDTRRGNRNNIQELLYSRLKIDVPIAFNIE